MPITLSTLFTTPNDIWDYLSVEGVDLRLDDHNLSSGQIITTTADALVNATSISVSALPVALLRGTVLTFENASMSDPVQVTLNTIANLGDTTLSVTTLTTQINSGATARDSGVNAATGKRLTVAARKGTSKVKLYCNSRYDDSQLKLCGSVLDWATIIAAKFLCERRAQGCPKSLRSEYDEVIEELKMVQAGQLQLEDAGTRGVDWPSISNLSVNPSYDYNRARVEPNLSEATPTAYPQYLDWNSAVYFG